MIFSSTLFLCWFLPIFLLIYFSVGSKLKNYVLLLSSIIFYGWGSPWFLLFILITTTVDFYFVNLLFKSQSKLRKKIFLIISLSINLGLLLYFKYCNFFVENINIALASSGAKEIAWKEIILPIGISFYTFESITYVVDVYRGLHKPLNNFLQYQMYILCFPKLIAGPIVRYHEISNQIENRNENDSIDNKLSGFYRFCIGLAKKVLIANTMAKVADSVFLTDTNLIDCGMAWVGMFSYTFQIYFDFSGYSDMAIGIGKMIGFKFPENFNNPYSSGSITEFWRRWHMTLGNWMKNYLYIPLGGNRVKSNAKLYINLVIVFLASGFWHGAAWTFVLWGIYHGVFLVLERIFLLKVYKKFGKFISVPITFFIISIGWILFRSENVEYALLFVKKLFIFDNVTYFFSMTNEYFFFFTLSVLFSFLAVFKFSAKIQSFIYGDSTSISRHISLSLVSVSLFFISLSVIILNGYNPFIYFRF